MKEYTIKVSGEGDNVLDKDLPNHKVKLTADRENLKEARVVLPTDTRAFRATKYWTGSGDKWQKNDIGVDYAVGGIPLALEAQKISTDRYSSLSPCSLNNNRIFTDNNYFCRIFYNKENV